MPPHQFVSRYRIFGNKQWHKVTESTLAQHLPVLYQDHPLGIYGEEDDLVLSTLSQPSFVLFMLDLLQLKEGLRVLEVGAGSGWNAALMAKLVGPKGHVDSIEIIPELAVRASKALSAVGIKNVNIIEGDGGDGYESVAPYDRAIFTAGSFDLPRSFYKQLKNEALLLMVIKTPGGGDTLSLLKKVEDHFESIFSRPCGFVPLTGKYRLGGLDPISLQEVAEWRVLKEHEVFRQAFWWGGTGIDESNWRTAGIRSYLGITEDNFQIFKGTNEADDGQDVSYFGLWSEERESLVLVKSDEIIAYGSLHAKERFMKVIYHWVDLGMPSSSSFNLKIYPIDKALVSGTNEWITKRRESQFIWSL